MSTQNRNKPKIEDVLAQLEHMRAHVGAQAFANIRHQIQMYKSHCVTREDLVIHLARVFGKSTLQHALQRVLDDFQIPIPSLLQPLPHDQGSKVLDEYLGESQAGHHLLEPLDIAVTRDPSSDELAAERAARKDLEAQLAKARGEGAILAHLPLTELEDLYEQAQNAASQLRACLKRKRDAENHCPICMERPKNTAIVPCGHFACDTCIHQLTQCHVCRGEILHRLRTYM
mmetsp:Transcript_60502/g.100435  ORF Transcript_60502/g.100435 Transcript_60502/m.100435 type:complete len:230 (+) Transcript_60502:55-744(+)